MSEFQMHQPGGRQPMQVMPEHHGCTAGTAKMVHDACDKWLRKRGLLKSIQELREDSFERRKVRAARAKKSAMQEKVSVGSV